MSAPPRETDMTVTLVNAVRSLSAGVASLKVAVELLTARVEELREDIARLSELMSKSVESFQTKSDDLIKKMADFSEKAPRELKLSFDLFLEGLSKTVNEIAEEYSRLLDELCLLRGKLSEGLTSVFSECNELRSEVMSLRTSQRDAILLLTELAAKFDQELSVVKSELHELELLVADLSARVNSLAESRASGQVAERKEGS